jgi:hypothetical protein
MIATLAIQVMKFLNVRIDKGIIDTTFAVELLVYALVAIQKLS